MEQEHICTYSHTQAGSAEGQFCPLALENIAALALVSHIRSSNPTSHQKRLQQCQLGPISPCQLQPPGRLQHHGAGITITPLAY